MATVSTSGQKFKYRRYNKTSDTWELLYPETSAEQVQQDKNNVFLDLEKNKINNKTFGSISGTEYTPTAITLYGSDITISSSDSKTLDKAVTYVNKAEINNPSVAIVPNSSTPNTLCSSGRFIYDVYNDDNNFLSYFVGDIEGGIDPKNYFSDNLQIAQYVDTRVAKINQFSYLVSSNAANTPEGVTWKNSSGETIIGELKATAATKYKIYLVPHSHSTGDIYDEYLTAQQSTTSYVWEKIGNTDVDLSSYVKGPSSASSNTNKVVLFNDTTGKSIKASTCEIVTSFTDKVTAQANNVKLPTAAAIINYSDAKYSTTRIDSGSSTKLAGLTGMNDGDIFLEIG